MSTSVDTKSAQPDTDVIIIGAGIAGIYAVHRFRDQKGFSVKGFEAAGGVGGVWEWNRYPGARVDVECMQYSYSFSPELEQEWRWSERFITQPELLEYLNHVADRFDVKKEFEFSTKVTSCVWDEENSLWAVTTDKGDVHTARFLVACTGALSAPTELNFPGLEKFKGDVYRTSNWPHHDVEWSGKRVAVFGTGSTGVQVVSEIANKVDQLTVFQRTAGYALPAQNRPLSDKEWDYWKTNYRHIRRKERQTFGGLIGGIEPLPSAIGISKEERDARYALAIKNGGKFNLETFSDILTNMESNKTAGDYIADLIRRRVDDPETAELLIPKDHPFSSKRVIYEIDYYEKYNLDHVDLVSIKNVPFEITETGVQTPDKLREFDMIIFATGFDAMTGPVLNLNLTGKNGLSLQEKWKNGPRTYLGMSTHGFPNFFMVLGPQSAAALYNNMLAIEDHVEYVSNAIEFTHKNSFKTIESDVEAEEDWTKETNEAFNATIFAKAESWYVGANVPGKPRAPLAYLGGAPKYRKKCADIVANMYEGYTFDDYPGINTLEADKAMGKA